MPQRDYSIDILRFIALLGLICIHVSPPVLWVREIRSFDVPLMVFLSGVSYSLGSGKDINYWDYVKKRFVRIILPTWIFLIVYFAVHYVTKPSLFFRTSTLLSFSLFTGFYTWIMRVFFIVAIISPLVLAMVKKLTIAQKIAALVLALFVNEFLIYKFCQGLDNGDYIVMVIMNLAYLIVFVIGACINQVNKKSILPLSIICVSLYIILAVIYAFVDGTYRPVSLCKYPPKFYYLIFGFACIFLLWNYRHQITSFLGRIRLKSFAQFVGSHTMWIYFWHIFMVEIVTERLSIDSALFRFCLVLFPAILITFLQSIIITRVGENIKDTSKQKLLYTLLNG